MKLKVKHWITRAFDDLKIKYKLLLSSLILISIPLIILSLIIYNLSSNLLHKYVAFSAEQSFSQTHSYLSYLCANIIYASDIIANDYALNEILMKNPATYNRYDQVLDMRNMMQFLYSFQNDRDICRVRLNVQSGLIYSSENTILFDIESVKSSVWYQKLLNASDKVLFCPADYLGETDANGLGVLSVARAIRNRNNYTENIAVLRLDIDMGSLTGILKDANPTDSSATVLVNSEGVTVASSSNNGQIARQTELLLARNTGTSRDAGEFTEMMLGTDRVMMMERLIPNTDWSMITIVPYDSFHSEQFKIQTTLLLLLLLASGIASALAYVFAESITRRIYRLINQMRAVRQNRKFDKMMINAAKDEIGELYDNYNYMMKQISELIREEYKLGQDVKSAELKALQAQINPHFLYNTLDMISWMSRMNKTSEVAAVVEALANFYKLTLNKGKDIVTIRDELKHVSYYIQIQALRFNNQITADFDVDPKVLDTAIPKITLQSLVENAIHHGILETAGKRGHISIKGRLEGDFVVLSVHDDGVGIAAGKLPDMSAADQAIQTSGSHYGLKNVNLRIKLIFGEACGLTFYSEPGKGTTVEVRLPYQDNGLAALSDSGPALAAEAGLPVSRMNTRSD